MENKSEKEAVQDFYKKSTNYKEMKKLCFNDVSKEFKDFMNQIKNADTFSTVLSAIDTLAPDFKKDPTTQKATTAINFFGGFMSSDSSFAYYLGFFRNEVINYAVDNNFEMEIQTSETEPTLQ